eukprot:Plantae.Rhodophyta-Hildenbrandia_rubra.ctg37368.p1 GENE.Plantae.Rhodophyta-Hildenbrandia_rubra.ctg37368~~Plantae.Rhodophyta-Hildenbrandia_rubra.ctg37368.p1  ORF type:complete len:461 (-),score=55.92 Plantae.Rhodophyta-Hildenbrandia_rubra.ctg37368:506-1888(-)
MKLSGYDIFRKVPRDLTHGTTHGAILSIFAFLLMSLLFTFELWTYLAGKVETSVMLDTNRNSLLQINFKITVLQLPCEFTSIDVWDYLGNNKLDLAKDLHKTMVTGERGEHILGAWDDGMSTSNGDNAVEYEQGVKLQLGMDESETLNKDNFDDELKKNTWSFVDFYANWCSHCLKLAPTWEAFAKTVHDKHIRVKVYKVDCVVHEHLCLRNGINSYPTLRVYKGHQPMIPDYRGKRTVEALLNWMESMTNEHEHSDEGQKSVRQTRQHRQEGCLVLGSLWVNRVPGNFHITAKSKSHDFDPKSTNLSHIVHHFSFGPKLPRKVLRHLPAEVRSNINPLDGRSFINEKHEPHTSHEHYIKVVSTHYRVGKSSLFGHSDAPGYQMTATNHKYKSDPAVPEAKFSFDLSPTAIVIVQGGKRFYEWLTSVCAIIGGAFTVFSLLDGGIYAIRKTIKGGQGKLS